MSIRTYRFYSLFVDIVRTIPSSHASKRIERNAIAIAITSGWDNQQWIYDVCAIWIKSIPIQNVYLHCHRFVYLFIYVRSCSQCMPCFDQQIVFASHFLFEQILFSCRFKSKQQLLAWDVYSRNTVVTFRNITSCQKNPHTNTTTYIHCLSTVYRFCLICLYCWRSAICATYYYVHTDAVTSTNITFTLHTHQVWQDRTTDVR